MGSDGHVPVAHMQEQEGRAGSIRLCSHGAFAGTFLGSFCSKPLFLWELLLVTVCSPPSRGHVMCGHVYPIRPSVVHTRAARRASGGRGDAKIRESLRLYASSRFLQGSLCSGHGRLVLGIGPRTNDDGAPTSRCRDVRSVAGGANQNAQPSNGIRQTTSGRHRRHAGAFAVLLFALASLLVP